MTRIDVLATKSDATGCQPRTADGSILLAAKGGGIVLAGTFFAYGSRFLIGILMARLLGAEQYGLYSLALTAGTVAAGLALLGLEEALVRYVSLFASQRDTAGLWGALQVGLGLTTIASLLLGAGLYVLAAPIAERLFHEPQLAPLLRQASLFVPLLALGSALAAATRGFNRMQYTVIAQQVAQPVTRIVLIVLLALIGLTAAKAVTVYSLGLLVTCVLLVYFLNQMFPLRRPLQAGRRDTKRILAFSLPAYGSRLIDTFRGNLQAVLLGALNTAATVGIYAVAAQVSTIGSMFNRAIGTASLPIVSELHGRGDREQMARFYQTTTKWMFTANLPLLLIVLLYSESILSIFGAEFVGGSTALAILAWASLATAAAGTSGGILNMTGNTQLKLVNSVVLAVLAIGLSALLIPRWGVVGAATAALVSAGVVSALCLTEVYVLFRMLPYNATFLKPIVAGLAALFLGVALSHLLSPEAPLIAEAAGAFLVAVVYVSMILVLGLSAEDRAVLARLRERVTSVVSRS